MHAGGLGKGEKYTPWARVTAGRQNAKPAPSPVTNSTDGRYSYFDCKVWHNSRQGGDNLDILEEDDDDDDDN